jgi:hypothetical protein
MGIEDYTIYEQDYKNKSFEKKDFDYNEYLRLELTHILNEAENKDLNYLKKYLRRVINLSPANAGDKLIKNYSNFTKSNIHVDINKIDEIGIRGDEDEDKVFTKDGNINIEHIKKLIGFVGLFMKIQEENYGKGQFYQIPLTLNPEYYRGGRRRNQPKHADMTMKDIKELCKANQIKLSRVIDDKRVCYKKKELLTKLKRKKII